MSSTSEIADAEIADCALVEQSLEAAKRLLEPWTSSPMQEIEIDAVGLEPPETALARGDGAGPRRVLRLHLADDEAAVAPPFHCLGNDLFGTPFAIELGGVDQRHAEIEPQSQRSDLVVEGALALAHAPGALAEPRDSFARRKRDGGKSGLRHDRAAHHA